MNAFTGKSLAVLAANAEWSFLYARNFLKAPFPEGEAAITTSAEWSYFYARSVLDAPWPKGEAVIATSAEWSNK